MSLLLQQASPSLVKGRFSPQSRVSLSLSRSPHPVTQSSVRLPLVEVGPSPQSTSGLPLVEVGPPPAVDIWPPLVRIETFPSADIWPPLVRIEAFPLPIDAHHSGGPTRASGSLPLGQGATEILT